ncbi:MAG TPA: hypothetical protein VMT28_15900 [Terriglobales bacterium]|jgi:hypothetical protein|nr:hypothetical protein [Terriglobales bacterium]
MVFTRDSSNDELIDLQFASDQQALAPALAVLADCARAAAERSDAFWQQQHQQVRRRIAESERSSRRIPVGLAWATALALALVAAAMLGSAPLPAPAPAATAVPEDSDQQLLMAVEQAVQSRVPDSLEPASLLAEEMGQAAQTSSQLRHKETRDEN